MDWKTLLDGLLGAVLGGLIGASAALRASRQQIRAQVTAAEAERLELRLDRSRTAAVALLERLADLDAELWSLPHAAKERMARYSAENGALTPVSPRLAAAIESIRSLRRGLLTELPVVTDPLITKHYRELETLASWFSVSPRTPEEADRIGVGLGRYTRWVQILIAEYVAERPSLADIEPPAFVPGHILDPDNDWEPEPKPDGWS
ncbi:hypothetical protein ABIA31_001293 [Catenulispora sp. MAP5-51]|jgi:hypothetical protein|uniref:hypothetical protein n=1 Tax=Catenulispora sp. MAP5-51 TaxID=3156298 RepID=UPI003511631E